VYYLATKAAGSKEARRHLETLLSLFDVAAVGRDVLAGALQLGFPDFEDAVLHEAGRHAGAEGIVTRNSKDFARSRLRIYEPAELLAIVQALPRA
jgi:hypothetical protein